VRCVLTCSPGRDALPVVRGACTFQSELTSQSECFPPACRRRPAVALQTNPSSWSTGDIEDFRELARTFCQKELTPHQQRWIDQKQVDRELWTKAGEVGLLALSIPEEYGGGGGSFAHEAVLYEEQARAGDGCWGVSVHNGIVAHYLLNYGNEQQKQEWLPKFASGEWIGAVCMTEPGTGSDLQSITTQAVRDGDEYVINGSKTFITNGA